MTSALVIVVGVLLALILPVGAFPLLTKLGAVDVPNSRSSHVSPTIRGMGIVTAAVACVTTTLLAFFNRDIYAYIMSITLLGAAAAVLGFVEDLRGVRIAKRAGMQVLIGGGFGFLVAWSSSDQWIWILISAFAVSAYINVANFMDGINGISGLHGGVVGASFAILGLISDRLWMVLIGLVGAGVFLAFLPWNLSRRKVFLGDVGSYFLGAWIAGTAVLAVASGLNPLVALGPTVIYLADTGFTLVRRIHRRERWFEAHRSHVYQQLASRSGRHLPVALVVASFSMFTSVVSLLSLHPSWIASVASLGLMALSVVVYLNMPRIVSKGKYQLSGETI